MRLWNCAASCVKQLAKPCAQSEVEGENWAIHVEAECRCSPYRVVYDLRKMHTATAWKGRDKVSDLHRHNDALRIAGKAILKGVWREARRLHLAIDPALAGDEGLPEQHPDAIH
jgi:hypothetical protein